MEELGNDSEYLYSNFEQVKGAEVTFHIYPSGIYSSDPELAGFDLPVCECICGYEYDLPAGCAAQVTTVLSRIN